MEPVVADLASLVAFDTVSDRPVNDLAAWLANRCENLGFRIEKFPDPNHPGKGTLIASRGPADTEGLVLSGHMDVVPTEGQPWSTDPFQLTEKDGKLYGRGSADMKGFFAATLQALARVPATDLTRQVMLVWTHDEEIGCLGSAHLADALSSTGRRLPSACLIGEPTDFQILHQHPGHVAVKIEVEGLAAHSSRPQLGVNAIEGAMRVIQAIHEVSAQIESGCPEGTESPWVPINVARIEGGSAINIVPDRCVIHLGYRPPPGMHAHHVFEQISNVLEQAAQQAKVTATLLRVSPSLLTRLGTPLQRALSSHVRNAHVGTATFATDGGNLARLGCEPLIFGPGSIEVAHKADEFVETADLVRAIDVIESVIRRMAG